MLTCSPLASLPCSILYEQLQQQFNFNDIGKGQTVPRHSRSNQLSPSTFLIQTLYSLLLFWSNNDIIPHFTPWHFYAIQLPSLPRRRRTGDIAEEHWLKTTYLKTTTHKKNVIPQRRAVWLTPVSGMINDSIFCLCCLLPLAAVAIYHHPLSAVESSSDSASQQTFSTHSRTTRGNYYCQNNNGLA